MVADEKERGTVLRREKTDFTMILVSFLLNLPKSNYAGKDVESVILIIDENVEGWLMLLKRLPNRNGTGCLPCFGSK